jgi:hypothetical protein
MLLFFAFLLIALALAPGCTWLMGQDMLPHTLLAFRVRQEKVTSKLGDLVADASLLGVGERIATERNGVGRVARAVNAYGDDTLVFDIGLMNAGEGPASVEPSKAKLTASLPSVTRAARTLDDFRQRWPTWAVDGAEQGADRTAAIGFVLDTLLLDRLIEGGARTQGRVVFPITMATERLELTLPAKTADHAGALTFVWEVF